VISGTFPAEDHRCGDTVGPSPVAGGRLAGMMNCVRSLPSGSPAPGEISWVGSTVEAGRVNPDIGAGGAEAGAGGADIGAGGADVGAGGPDCGAGTPYVGTICVASARG
jgi:hypothetical protein